MEQNMHKNNNLYPIYIVHISHHKQDAVQQFGDVDARGILQILGSISLLLDDDKCKKKKKCKSFAKDLKNKFFPGEKIAHNKEDTDKKMEILENINRVSHVIWS